MPTHLVQQQRLEFGGAPGRQQLAKLLDIWHAGQRVKPQFADWRLARRIIQELDTGKAPAAAASVCVYAQTRDICCVLHFKALALAWAAATLWHTTAAMGAAPCCSSVWLPWFVCPSGNRAASVSKQWHLPQRTQMHALKLLPLLPKLAPIKCRWLLWPHAVRHSPWVCESQARAVLKVKLQLGKARGP